MRRLIADMGLRAGPLDAIPADAKVPDFAWSGKSTDAMTSLLSGRAIRWYEEDREIRFASSAEQIQADAEMLLLRKDTGLIGAPSITEEGMVLTRSTLKPAVKMGRINSA